MKAPRVDRVNRLDGGNQSVTWGFPMGSERANEPGASLQTLRALSTTLNDRSL
jgi:hypothetical protein